MSSNPYSDDQQPSPYVFESQNPSAGGDPYVKQIPVVGVLSIIQASLELLMSLVAIGTSVFMGLMQNDPKFQQVPNVGSMKVFAIGYGIFGIAIGTLAVVRLASGIQILRKKSRMFSIVASILGLTSVFTCYCSITSIGLCIYTLIVLVQPSVIEEFEKART